MLSLNTRIPDLVVLREVIAALRRTGPDAGRERKVLL